VVGESFHPDGRKYQVDLERGRGHCRGAMAAECIWTISFALAYPRWLRNELAWARVKKGRSRRIAQVFIVFTAPEREFQSYERTIQQMLRSVRINRQARCRKRKNAVLRPERN
jgi:hypothetical protein